MIWKRKKSLKRNFIWIPRGKFINLMLLALQNGLDMTDNDIRLRYAERVSFPQKYRAIEIEFPDGKMRSNVAELDLIAEELIHAFRQSKEFEKALHVLYWYTADSRNIASELDISYVLTNACGKNQSPGVIIYWEK